MYITQLILCWAIISNVSCNKLSVVKDLLEDLQKTIAQNVNDQPHPDVGLDIYQFLRRYDYPVETHWVHTEDGYVLRMQRLLGGKNGTFYGKENKPAVLLVHGLLSSSIDFLNMGPNKSLGLVLADAGYDVWLGNTRGNTWSRNHVTLDPDSDPEFWDYSFETCGYYDLPAKIDYIIAKTGQKKIFYVGHSLGTTQFFAMAALRPEYNDKIALMSALAPVAYMGHVVSPLMRIMAKYQDLLQFLFENVFHFHEVLSHSWLIPLIAKLFLTVPTIQEFGTSFLFLLCGFNNYDFDRSMLPIIATNAPAGTSVKMLIHYGQEINSGKFRRYDYGFLLNLKHYKSPSPPDYNISAITAPIAIYYSQNDFFAAVEDVEKFSSQLPNVFKKRLIENKRFNHLDYIWSKDVNEVINQDLIESQDELIPKPTSSANLNFSKNPFYVIGVLVICTIGLQ